MRLILILTLLLAPLGLSCAEPSLGHSTDSPATFPTVRVEKNQRMLVVVAKGDPDRNGDSAVRSLLRHFFRGAGEAEKNASVRPRVRWALRSPSIPRSSWIATYALPVSENFPEPPRGPASVVTWQYGLIVEAAYSGPYANAQPSIDSLKAYAARSGFALVGGLEEEFERGRGTLYQGHPEAYHTILRYRIHEGRGSNVDEAPLSSN
ncbi:MAG: hypothetical protein JF616_16700 [Fibrobacteres bacterium]|nr:hypothetical protein [Fibrobacterota bacterium]